MKTSNPCVDKAIKNTRNLVARLHASVKHGAASAPSEDPLEVGFTFFTTSRGGLRLTGKEDDVYQECLESLLSVHGSRKDARAMSSNAVARPFRTTLVACLRPTPKPASSGAIDIRRGVPEEADAALTAEPAALAAAVYKGRSLAEAGVVVQGNRTAAKTFCGLFTLPAKA